jgi:hypothetical protein
MKTKVKILRSNVKNQQFVFYFQYNEMKMQGLTKNLSGRPYYKNKEIIQTKHQEETTETKMKGQEMIRNEFT